jgi:hypothetical protein
MKLSRTFIALILFSFGVGALQAQTPTTPSQPQDCGHFVQQFYDWYVAKENALMKRNSLESALEVTLREKRSSFSPELVKGLKEDLAASKNRLRRSWGWISIPFSMPKILLNATSWERSLRREIIIWSRFLGLGGQKKSNPDVVPELALENGQWIFTNFHYGKTDIPVNENLLSVLQILKKDRRKNAK